MASAQAPTFPRYNELPAEIRQNIIANLVVAPDGIGFHADGRVRLPASLTGPQHISLRERREWIPNYLLVSKEFHATASHLFVTRNTFVLEAGCADYDHMVGIPGRGPGRNRGLRARVRHVVLNVEVGAYAIVGLDGSVAAALEDMVRGGGLWTVEVRMSRMETPWLAYDLYRVWWEIVDHSGPSAPVPHTSGRLVEMWHDKARLLVRILLCSRLRAGSLKVKAEDHPKSWCGLMSGDRVCPADGALEAGGDDEEPWVEVDLEKLAGLYGIAVPVRSV